MTRVQREAFLAEVRIGVLGAEGGAAYAPGRGSHGDALLTLDIERWRTTDFGKLE